MTSREYLSKLVRTYSLERFKTESIDIDIYNGVGETVFLDTLEELLADFEMWRAVHEIRANERNSACLI